MPASGVVVALVLPGDAGAAFVPDADGAGGLSAGLQPPITGKESKAVKAICLRNFMFMFLNFAATVS